MRPSLCLLILLFTSFVVVPPARGDDGRQGGDAPTVEQLLERILSSNETENAIVAQYLRQADHGTVIELLAKIREAIRPEWVEPEAPDLREVLRRMREKEPEPKVALIEVTTRILDVDVAAQASICSAMGITVGSEPTVLDPVATARLEREIARHEGGVRNLTAPKISMLAGQKADISMLNQMSYISGYDLVRRADGDVADPQVGTLQEGLVLRLRCEVGPAPGSVRLRLAGTWAEVTRPLAVCEAPVGTRGGKVKIQVPHTELTCRDVDVLLPKGTTALVRGVDRGAQGAQWLSIAVAVREVGAAFLEDVVEEAPPAREAPPPPPTPTPSGPVVNIEVRIVEVPVADAPSVLGAEAAVENTTVTYLTDRAVADLLQRIQAAEKAKVVSAPGLTVYDGQKANVSMLNDVSYVQDFETETGNTTTVTPIIGVLKEGLVLELRPTLSGDRKFVTLELDGTWAQVIRPIPDFKARLAGQEVTIQLPEMTVRRSRATVRLPDGGSVLVRGERSESAQVEVVLLVRAQVVDLDDEERKLFRGKK